MILKKILQVDDDEDISAILQLSLTALGQFELRQCTDGPSAVAVAGEFRPQLLLLDLMMPGMTGEEAWKQIISIPGLEKTPAVFLTAKSDKAMTDRLLDEGAAAVLSKPFDPVGIVEQINKIWEGIDAKPASESVS